MWQIKILFLFFRTNQIPFEKKGLHVFLATMGMHILFSSSKWMCWFSDKAPTSCSLVYLCLTYNHNGSFLFYSPEPPKTHTHVGNSSQSWGEHGKKNLSLRGNWILMEKKKGPSQKILRFFKGWRNFWRKHLKKKHGPKQV